MSGFGVVALCVVLSITDGDTFRAECRTWTDEYHLTAVRLNGIDTPEIHGKCENERQLALKAKEWLASKIEGKTLYLTNIENGKFAGRVLARIQGLKFDQPFHRPYDGGKRQSWCSDIPS